MKKSLFILLLLFAGQVFAHKFYVSIAELEYNSEKARIEGSLKVTAHDFEAMLENKFGKKFYLEEVADTSKVGLYIQSYLADRFKLYSSGKQATPNYVGKEVTLRQDAYFYFTFTNVTNPASIKIVNTVLFGQFPKQQNIVHYRYKEQTKSVTLVPSKIHEKITFN